MALLNQSVQVYAQIPKLFETLRAGQAPSKFTREFLKDIGFKSSNHLAFIPLLKGLRFLTADGTPTQRYSDFLDPTRWRKVIAEALRDAYSDIFVIKSRPTKGDKDLIAGKYKSAYNISDISADRSARTFLALLDLADEDALYARPGKDIEARNTEYADHDRDDVTVSHRRQTDLVPLPTRDVGLHYNIQIHLPATKDIEVYNAIFRSLREHLIG